MPISFDQIAYEQPDMIIPLRRVKPPADLREPIESGLCKQTGAVTLHPKDSPSFTLDPDPRAAVVRAPLESRGD